MIELRFSLLMALLVAAASVFADSVPAEVQTVLGRICPRVNRTVWSQDDGYYYADFMMSGYEESVQSNTQGQWQMAQTEWGDTDESSATTYNVYALKSYPGWQVEDVACVEFPK